MTKKDNLIREKILKGLELTHSRLIRTKRKRNLCLIVSDHGKVVKVKAKDFLK